MDKIKSCNFPELSPEFTELFNDSEKGLIIVGVIGKSVLPNCNKMLCFDLFSCHSIFLQEDGNGKERVENRIKFYYEEGSRIMFVHFETSFDLFIANDVIKNSDVNFFLPFGSELRTRFARMLLFATQICHLIVLVEPSSEFDATSYLSIFKALKIIREKYVLKFLPKLLKNTPTGNAIAKEYRLCSPRFIFFFEKVGRVIEDLTAYEIAVEDSIYQMLRANFIITNNSNLSLFSVPKNKKFLYLNTDDKINSDPVVDSVEFLMQYINADGDNEEDFQISPYRGYAKNYFQDLKTKDEDEKPRSFLKLLNEHVDEAISTGFDDSIAKYRGKNHFVRPPMKTWYEVFKFMHKIFIENPNNSVFEAKDPDYKAYLENFNKILDIDEQFFYDSCIHGYDLAILNYSELLPHHYSKTFHETKLYAALEIFHKYARGPESERLENKLKDNCESIWLNGRQQCETMSLRGNPCIMTAKHLSTDGSNHSSGVMFVSTCNCGKTQGRREDPYTIKKANFQFYQVMTTSCSLCEKALKIDFPVFVPSSTEFKAADITNKNIVNLILSEYSNKTPTQEKVSDHQLHLSASQKTQASESDLSIGSDDDDDDDDEEDKVHKNDDESDDEDINEIVVKIGEMDVKEEQAEASTTEYLPGMILSTSPVGLLPQFPSWSLMCIGPSSLYSHNTGLTESQQPGFLSTSHYLLAWDVKVRLEHAQTWAENYEKSRNRKKHKQLTTQSSSGTFFTLKIFVGMEYECPRGHRFFMDSNQSVLRGSGGGSKTCGSKVVLSNMPLFFPCPCRQKSIAQLMRVHCVTPKAPVFITMDPKIRIRHETEMIFIAGWNEPIKLTQSTYWVLRLPFVYQGDNSPIPVPQDVPNSTEALRYGCLLEGIFGIKEDDSGENYS